MLPLTRLLDHLYQIEIPDLEVNAVKSSDVAAKAKCNVAAQTRAKASTLRIAQTGNGGEHGLTHETTMELIAGRGDRLPVSAMPSDGTFPTGTAKLKNATSHWMCLSGIHRFAFSAANASWYVRMP